MSLFDLSGHRLAAIVTSDRIALSARVRRFLTDIGDPVHDAAAALEVRIAPAAAADPPAGHRDVTWSTDDAGVALVAWRDAGQISGVDGSGVAQVGVHTVGPAADWMIRTAVGSAACASGRVVGVHGCVLRAPDGTTVLLLGPGGSGKTSLALWLVSWRGYRLLVEDFVYLRPDWSIVTAPVRDFVTLRRWTWDLLADAPAAASRPARPFPLGATQVRAPLDPWLHRVHERVVVDALVRVRRAETPGSTLEPSIAVDRALAGSHEVAMTEWLGRFARRRPGPRALPPRRRRAAALRLGSDWPDATGWLDAFEAVTSVHAA